MLCLGGRRPPRSTRPGQLFPYTTLCLSDGGDLGGPLRLVGDLGGFALDAHLEITAELDVGAAAGHVGGNGDGTGHAGLGDDEGLLLVEAGRSEEHTSELQSLMRISYAVFCLKNKIMYASRCQHHTT